MNRWMRRLLIGATALAVMLPAIAIAGDRFTDVPDTDPFHTDIGWLADAGVTAGCNPPANDEFCPEDPVKRKQMAAFMRRFAVYLGAEDGIVDSADDADTLDGVQANEIVRAAASDNPANVGDWDGTEIEDIVAIEAPSRGMLIISYTVNLGKDNSGGGTGIQSYSIEGRLDGTELGDGGDTFELNFDDANDTTEAYQRVVTVDPGTYDVSVAIRQAGAPTTDLTFVYDRSLTVLFVPFDGGGATPSLVADVASSGGNNN